MLIDTHVLVLTLPGAPRTKKNHGRVIQRGKRKFHIQSEAYERWNQQAQLNLCKLRSGWHMHGAAYDFVPFTVPVNCCALFYREALIGDAVGYYQALADALQEGQVVQDDKLICSWDGSRLLKDSLSPRIEIRLEPCDLSSKNDTIALHLKG